MTLSVNNAPFFAFFVRFSELLDCWLNTYIRSQHGNWYLNLLQVDHFPRFSKINNFISLFP